MYINILFIIIMIVAVIMIARHNELSRALKGFVITMLLLSIALATLFEYSSRQSDVQSRPIINAFKQGKTLRCKEQEISLKTYSYEPGTSSFQPLLNVVGETYALKECKPSS
jgi:disulfide bond formation protein DsbB